MARIPLRRRIAIACEGQSEESYVRLLGGLFDSALLHLHVQALVVGKGAGNALVKLRKAECMMQAQERKRSRFWKKAVLLDFDLVESDTAQLQLCRQFAAEHGIAIIWQRPCHEALLLRHFKDCGGERPKNATLSQSELLKAWPNYRKPMNRLQLSKKIDETAVRRALTVEPELAVFLGSVGWK